MRANGYAIRRLPTAIAMVAAIRSLMVREFGFASTLLRETIPAQH